MGYAWRDGVTDSAGISGGSDRGDAEGRIGQGLKAATVHDGHSGERPLHWCSAAERVRVALQLARERDAWRRG